VAAGLNSKQASAGSRGILEATWVSVLMGCHALLRPGAFSSFLCSKCRKQRLACCSPKVHPINTHCSASAAPPIGFVVGTLCWPPLLTVWIDF